MHSYKQSNNLKILSEMASSGVLIAKIGVALFLVISMVLWGGAMAQSGCTNVLIGMSPCLNYVTGSSKTPTSSCCSSLASVVRSQPQCLCTVLNGGASAALGININQTLALALPGACNVQTPPVSKCDAGKNAPAMAPVESPESLPPEYSAESPTSSSMSGEGSKAVPENGATSDANGTTKMPHQLAACILLFMAFIVSSF